MQMFQRNISGLTYQMDLRLRNNISQIKHVKYKYCAINRIFNWKNNKNTNNTIRNRPAKSWQVLKNRLQKNEEKNTYEASLLPYILSLCSRFNLFGNFRFPIPFHLVRCPLAIFRLCTVSVTFLLFTCTRKRIKQSMQHHFFG